MLHDDETIVDCTAAVWRAHWSQRARAAADTRDEGRSTDVESRVHWCVCVAVVRVTLMLINACVVVCDRRTIVLDACRSTEGDDCGQVEQCAAAKSDLSLLCAVCVVALIVSCMTEKTARRVLPVADDDDDDDDDDETNVPNVYGKSVTRSRKCVLDSVMHCT